MNGNFNLKLNYKLSSFKEVSKIDFDKIIISDIITASSKKKYYNGAEQSTVLEFKNDKRPFLKFLKACGGAKTFNTFIKLLNNKYR